MSTAVVMVLSKSCAKVLDILEKLDGLSGVNEAAISQCISTIKSILFID